MYTRKNNNMQMYYYYRFEKRFFKNRVSNPHFSLLKQNSRTLLYDDYDIQKHLGIPTKAGTCGQHQSHWT